MIRIRGKGGDVRRPHAIHDTPVSPGRGVARREIVASSHGVRGECGCGDQRGRHKGQFGHLFLHVMAEAGQALASVM